MRKASPFFFKRCRFQRGGNAIPCLSLAGRGGEGVDVGAGVAASVWRRCRRSLEAATSAAAPKRRCVSAAAILDRRNGPTALEHQRLSIFFLLHWRIFIDCSATINAATSPSGSVPGGGSGGRVCRSSFAGGRLELDRVSTRIFRVLSVIVRDLVVFSFSSGVLSVIVCPPPS